MNYTRQEQIEEQAEAFITKYPKAWSLFVDFTFEAITAGFTTYSGKAVIERMRWEMSFNSGAPEEFKINNNYCPYFVRWFMAQYPEHEGFFRVRKLTSIEKEPVTMPELVPFDFPYLKRV
jgi:hypothetical protein